MTTFVPGQKLRYRGDVESPSSFVRNLVRPAGLAERGRIAAAGVATLAPGAEAASEGVLGFQARSARKVRARKARRKSSVEDAGSAECATLNLLDHEAHFLSRSLKALTTRECEVVFAICRGGTNEWMAEALQIALPTLRTHLMRLNQKLGTRRKSDVVRFVAKALLEGYRSGALEAPLPAPVPMGPALG